MLEVLPVGSDRGLAREFVNLPFSIYRDDPHWVPPLRSSMRKQMRADRNPFLRHAEVEHFVAVDGGRPVARLATTVYPAYLERFDDKVGFFGFFEYAEGQEKGAEALLDAGSSWLADRGMATCAGPYNYCANQEMGLLASGGEGAPALFQTYNARRYLPFLTDVGFTVKYSARTYSFDIARVLADPGLVAGGTAAPLAGYRVRSLDKRRYGEDMELLRQLFNRSFAGNDDVLPYEQDVFASMAAELRAFVDADLICFVEREGQPIAFSIIVPDVNEVLQRLGGRVGPVDLLRLRGMIRSIRAAVLLLIGVLPEEQRTGVSRLLLARIVEVLRDRPYRTLHTTWVHEDNAPILAVIDAWRATPDKEYVIVERTIA